MNNTSLFQSRNVRLEGNLLIPDLNVLSGDVVWIQMENPSTVELFTAFVLGLIKIKDGRASLAGKSLELIDTKVVSCFDIVPWSPSLESIEYIMSLIAYSRGIRPSHVLSNFKRIINGIGAGYALSLPINKMNPVTKRMVSTAMVMALPALLNILIEPFEDLDKQGSDFLKEQIESIARDGSSFLILSAEQPCFYNKHIDMGTV